jgi:hypothetical protein
MPELPPVKDSPEFGKKLVKNIGVFTMGILIMI